MKETLSEEDANLLRKVIIDFNKCAMQYLNFDKIAESNSIFTKIVKVWKTYCKDHPDLTWLTMNNLSWLYK